MFILAVFRRQLVLIGLRDARHNQQRGVLGSALLEEKYVLLCLNARYGVQSGVSKALLY
jgi:hypothetical protein